MNELATNCGLFYSQKRLEGNEKQQGWLCEAGDQFYKAFLDKILWPFHALWGLGRLHPQLVVDQVIGRFVSV